MTPNQAKDEKVKAIGKQLLVAGPPEAADT